MILRRLFSLCSSVLISVWLACFFCLEPLSRPACAEDVQETDDLYLSISSMGSRELLHEARSLRNLKLYDQALEKYRELLLRDPKNSYTIKEMGDVCIERKDYAKAREYYDRAVFLRPYDPKLRLALARAYYNSGQKKEANAELERLLTQDAGFIEARKELAQYLSWEGKWEDAAKVYGELAQEKPEDVSLLLEKGRLLSWSGKWKEAIPIYEEALAKNPDDKTALKELALLYSWTQQWRKSQIAFEQLLKKTPGDSDALAELGTAYFYDQKYDAARNIYSQVKTADPGAAQRLAGRMNELSFAMAPTLTYSFLYYREKSKLSIPDDPEYGDKTRTVAESFYHMTEYAQPINRIFKWFALWGARYDTTIHRTSFIYGTGLQTMILKNLWHRIDWKWEPVNWEINPRWGLSNALTYKPWERYEVDLFHQFNTYWNNGDKSNTAGFGASRSFFKARDVLVGYRFTYDVIDDPSPYFVTIKSHDGDQASETLDLITNRIYVEKYWNLPRGSVLTTGSAYDVTSEGRNTYTAYLNLSYRVINHVSISGGPSASWDNKELQTLAASGAISIYF